MDLVTSNTRTQDKPEGFGEANRSEIDENDVISG